MLPASRRSSPPSLDGELRFDDRARAAAADDFGHLVHRTPEAVLLPASVADVAATVRWAAGLGRAFAAQGQRHSVYGRAQAGGGIVADLRQLRTLHDVQDDRVVADAGATWAEVLGVTLARGRTPPVLPDYLDLSVGGTLVVGGVGGTTWRLGVVSDHVLELQVVTGRGEIVTCSPTRHRRLFDTVRAGLGQVAVVTRATLRLVPAPQQVRRFLLSYAAAVRLTASHGVSRAVDDCSGLVSQLPRWYRRQPDRTRQTDSSVVCSTSCQSCRAPGWNTYSSGAW